MNQFLLFALWTLACAGCCLSANAQAVKVLSAEAFIGQVKQHHPVAKQATLVTEKADASLLAARGAFDPVVEWETSNKTLDGIGYYRYNNPELKVPTAAGVSLKAGYEDAGGRYINPELTNGVASYLGLEVSLLNGLLTDKKRTVLQQAKVYRRQSEQERLAMLNDLVFDAYNAYWDWAGAYQLYYVYDNFLQIAGQRARLISLSFKNGDRAMADTVEAYAQYQQYRLLKSEALLELNKKVIELSMYLWDENGEPYLLPPGYVPDTAQLARTVLLPDTTALIGQMRFTHPEVQVNRFKLETLEFERRLKLQNLLPTVNLQANLLSKDYFQYKNVSAVYAENNYKFGVGVKVPLLVRQGRGEYRFAKLKIREAQLDLAVKTQDVQNKIRKSYTEATQLQGQVQAAQEMGQAYGTLLRTEELKFSQGESSVFLLNARENKLLETQQKIIELRVKYMKAASAVLWSSATIL